MYVPKSRKNDSSIFNLTHYYSSKRSANRAKARIITNNAMLNYSIGNALKQYLKRLKRISHISYECQYPTVHNSEITYLQNANSLSKLALEDVNKLKQ